MMPYFCAVSGFSSTFSLTILTFSPTEPEISSRAGAIILHGPHHSAQKSTTTGLADLSTSASKFASETLPTAMKHLVRIGRSRAARGAANLRMQGGEVKADHREVSRFSAESSACAGI